MGFWGLGRHKRIPIQNPIPKPNTQHSYPMIITLDGPAGAGKSTVAKGLAVRLSAAGPKPFEYLDTGSMYRAIALEGIRTKVDWNDPAQLYRLAEKAKIDVVAGRTFLNGEDITDAVRSPEVTGRTKFAADEPRIRGLMVGVQRRIADRFAEDGKGLVTEGRDQGSVVFPDATFKIFLTATPEERALRRIGEMKQRGETVDYHEILRQIIERDDRDSARAVGPLRQPENAILFTTDGMDAETVIDNLVKLVLMETPTK